MSILNKLRFLFGLIKFEITMVGKDAKTYVTQELAIGQELYVQTDAETIVLVPAGSYQMEDGTTIEVDEAGIIQEIEAPEAETPETPETEMAEEPKQEEPKQEEPVEEFDAKLEIETLKTEIKKLQDALILAVEEKEKMAKEITELSKEPAATSITLTTDKVEEVSCNSTVSRLMNYKKNKR